VFGVVVTDVVKMLGGIEQGLRRYATDVQAGAAGSGLAVGALAIVD